MTIDARISMVSKVLMIDIDVRTSVLMNALFYIQAWTVVDDMGLDHYDDDIIDNI